MIVGGLGVGLVNPPLASTAVGVVPPQRAGMASGHQLDVPAGRHRHRDRAARHPCSPTRSRPRSRPRSPRCRAVAATAPRSPAAIQSGEVGQRHRAAACQRCGPRSGDHQVRVHRRPGSDPAGGGHHRAGVGRDLRWPRSAPGTSLSSRARQPPAGLTAGLYSYRMRKYVIMGVQGSGKGTQSAHARRRPRPCAYRRRGHLPVECPAPHQARRAGAPHDGCRRTGQ